MMGRTRDRTRPIHSHVKPGQQDPRRPRVTRGFHLAKDPCHAKQETGTAPVLQERPESPAAHALSCDNDEGCLTAATAGRDAVCSTGLWPAVQVPDCSRCDLTSSCPSPCICMVGTGTVTRFVKGAVAARHMHPTPDVNRSSGRWHFSPHDVIRNERTSRNENQSGRFPGHYAPSWWTRQVRGTCPRVKGCVTRRGTSPSRLCHCPVMSGRTSERSTSRPTASVPA